MSKESFARGFCKAAEAAGVDPIALVKLSQYGINGFRSSPAVGSWGMYGGGANGTNTIASAKGSAASGADNGTNTIASAKGSAASGSDSRIKHYRSLLDKYRIPQNPNPPMTPSMRTPSMRTIRSSPRMIMAEWMRRRGGFL